MSHIRPAVLHLLVALFIAHAVPALADTPVPPEEDASDHSERDASDLAEDDTADRTEDDSRDLIEVPSGQPIEFYELIRDVRSSRGLTWRFRFVAPEIARNTGSIAFGDAALDMDHLCQEYALPKLPLMGPKPKQIIISLSSAPTEFGEASPENTQFFEAYDVEDGTCIWEAY